MTRKHQAVGNGYARPGLGGGDTSTVMTWPESFDFTDAMLAEYARQAADTGSAAQGAFVALVVVGKPN